MHRDLCAQIQYLHKEHWGKDMHHVTNDMNDMHADIFS